MNAGANTDADGSTDPTGGAANSGGAQADADGTAPVFITDPQSLAVKPGTTAQFSVEVAGDPAPTVTWQSRSVITAPGASENLAAGSAALSVEGLGLNAFLNALLGEDSGLLSLESLLGAPAPAHGDWQQVTEGVSSDGRTLTVTATEALDGTEYRAVAVNEHGEAVSQSATLTVGNAAGTPEGSSNSASDGAADGTPQSWGRLAITGDGFVWWPFALAALLLAFGLSTMGASARARKRLEAE